MVDKISITENGCNFLLNTDDYICVATPERAIKFANRAFCALLQKTSDQLIGTKITDNLSEDQQRHYNTMSEKMSPANPAVTIIERIKVGAEPKWISWKQTGIYDDEGRLTELVAVGRNVNELVETKLSKDRLLLTAFRKAIDTNIICTITDKKGIITHANEKFCQVSKYQQHELIGRTHNFVNSGHHPRSFFTNMWRTIASGNVWTGQIKNKAKDGTYYWVESVIMPIKDEQEQITGYLSLRILIDEQKRLEQEKNEYMRSLEDMLFTVSHEIRKPITGCQGILYMMQERMPVNKEEYNEYVGYLVDLAGELDGYSRKLNDLLQKNIK